MTRRTDPTRWLRRGRLPRPAILALLAVLALGSAANGISTVWTRIVNGAADDDDSPYSLALAPNGDLYVVGYKTVVGQDWNIWIRKYGSNGATKWTRTINGPVSLYESAHGVAVDSAGNLYVVGYIFTSIEHKDIWIRKYSSAGTKLWTRIVDGPAGDHDIANSAAVDSSGNLYVVGSISVAGEDTNIWIRKYNSSGTKLWTRTVDGPTSGSDSAHGVAVDSTGSIFVVGYIDVSGEERNIWIRKYSSSGGKLWTRTVDGPASDRDIAWGAAVDSNGKLYVVGFTTVAGESANIWIRKYSSTGTKLWTRNAYGSANDFDSARNVAVDTNGAAYVIGGKKLVGGSAVVWIRKYSPTGVKRWTTTYAGPRDFASGYGIAVNATNRVYTTGYELTTDQGSDIWVRKYQQ